MPFLPRAGAQDDKDGRETSEIRAKTTIVSLYFERLIAKIPNNKFQKVRFQYLDFSSIDSDT
jgi:hypothetical protein